MTSEGRMQCGASKGDGNHGINRNNENEDFDGAGNVVVDEASADGLLHILVF